VRAPKNLASTWSNVQQHFVCVYVRAKKSALHAQMTKMLENGKIISRNGAETRLKNKTERKKAIIGGGDGNSKL